MTDEYVSVHAEHNFNGRLLARIPLLRKLKLREIVGARAVVGDLSDENIYLNQFDLTGKAPTKPYWEYHFGIDNILKFIRIDFVFRGNYRKVPGATNFGIKGGFGFYFRKSRALDVLQLVLFQIFFHIRPAGLFSELSGSCAKLFLKAF